MDKPIITALFIIVSMVMALTLFNVAYPAIQEGGEAITGMTVRAENRLRTDITIIHAASETDIDGNWLDTNGNGLFDVFVWVKNTGDSRILALDTLDVFFGPQAAFMRIPHESNAGSSYPRWTWAMENSAEFQPGSTLRLTIHYQLNPGSGQYFAKISTSEAISDEYYLGM